MFAAGLGWLANEAEAWTAAAVLGLTALLIIVRTVQECAAATAAFLTVVRIIERKEKIEQAEQRPVDVVVGRHRADRIPRGARRPPDPGPAGR